MIAQLTGTILEKTANLVVVDVRDVGYEVIVPVSTYYELGEVGEKVSLRIYTHVKEDALSLYGFRFGDEKELFTKLIQISGIGPKLGITILSGLPPDEFVQAIRQEDVARLNSIPGVGKKTAERLILEMRDKLVAWTREDVDTAPVGAMGALQSDVISALINLGYSRKEAEKRVTRAARETGSDQFEVILKKALSF